MADLYGAGLERILEHPARARPARRRGARRAGRRRAGRRACCWCTACTPTASRQRVERALESVRPYLGSHGGDVELLGVSDEGVGPAAAARQLRRLPVVVGDARARGRGRDRGGRPGDHGDRGRGRRRPGDAGTADPGRLAASPGSTRLGHGTAGSGWQAVPELAELRGRRRASSSAPRLDRSWPAGSARSSSPSTTGARAASRAAGRRGAGPRLGGDAGDAVLHLSELPRPLRRTPRRRVPRRARACTSARCPLLVDGGVGLGRPPGRWRPRDERALGGSPLGVAAPDHGRPGRRRCAGERCEMCAQPHRATSTSTWSTSRAAALMCTCRACYLLFTDSTPTLRYRAVPDRYLSFPDFEFGAAAVGRAADPGRAGVPVPQLGAGPRRRVLPGPGRRHRVRAARSTPGTGVVEANPRSPAAAGRRGAARAPRRPRAPRVRLPPGADRRLLRAGRPAAHAVARLRRRRRRRGPRSTSSSRRSRPAAGRLRLPRGPGAS